MKLELNLKQRVKADVLLHVVQCFEVRKKSASKKVKFWNKAFANSVYLQHSG